MIYPEADKLETWGNKYALVALAAKRAKQLKSGAPPLINTQSRNPLTVALEEIAAGKVTCRVPDTDFLPTTTIEPEVAELLAIPEDMREEESEEEETAATTLGRSDIDEEEEFHEDEDLEEWEEDHEEDEEEDEVLGIVPHIDEDEEVSDIDIDESPLSDELADKPKRGRRKIAEPEIPIDLDVEEIPDIDIDDIELPDDEPEEEHEEEHEEEWEEN
jgi:DNA-directed RNA polymerase subunit omega